MIPKKEISFIIPCYNEAPEVLYNTIDQLYKSLVQISDNFEIIVVNDGSTRYSYALTNICPEVVLVTHKYNKGYGASLKSGILKSSYDWIGITDADGTYPNSELNILFDHEDEFDMAIGARRWKDISFIRRLPKYVLTLFASFLADQKILDLNSGFRIFKKEMAVQFWHLYPNGFSFTSTITMAAITNRCDVKFVEIDYHKRIGKSNINPIKDTFRFFNLVLRLALYFNPKKFFMPMSGIFLLVALARGIRDYLINGYLGGLTLILFYLGFQIFFFGLLAEIINKTRQYLSYGNNKRA